MPHSDMFLVSFERYGRQKKLPKKVFLTFFMHILCKKSHELDLGLRSLLSSLIYYYQNKISKTEYPNFFIYPSNQKY